MTGPWEPYWAITYRRNGDTRQELREDRLSIWPYWMITDGRDKVGVFDTRAAAIKEASRRNSDDQVHDL